MRMVLDEPIVLPSVLRPDYPPALEAIVMRALERDPARRYQSARELREQLKAWLRADGQAHGKREVAEYLREVFRAKKQREADEFAGDSAFDDEDLQLEQALPRSESLEVDEEDAEPPPQVHAATNGKSDARLVVAVPEPASERKTVIRRPP